MTNLPLHQLKSILDQKYGGLENVFCKDFSKNEINVKNYIFETYERGIKFFHLEG